MIRVGILTFHKSINYGAVMQSYSLAKRLEKDFANCQIEIIDYMTRRMHDNYSKNKWIYSFSYMKTIKKNGWLKVIKVSLSRVYNSFFKKNFWIKRISLINAFERDWGELPLTQKTIISDDYNKVFCELKDKYDILITGSDCVWEFLNYPFPNVYFLNDDIASYHVSYAATSDRMNVNEVSEKEANYIREALERYSYIGIRDTATQNFLSGLNCRKQLYHNCDPTIFLQMNLLSDYRTKAKKKLALHGISFSKKIIFIMGTEEIGQMVRDIFGTVYQLVSVYSANRYTDVFLDDLTPLEWSQVFSFGELTYSNYFHGTILSLKNLTPCLFFDYAISFDEGDKTKGKDLLDRLGLNFLYHKRTDIKNCRKQISELSNSLLENPIKDKISEGLVRESLSYNSFKEYMSSAIQNLTGESIIENN